MIPVQKTTKISNNINIKDLRKYRDVAGLLGKELLVVDEVRAIYQVNYDARYAQGNLSICNPNGTQTVCKVWISNKLDNNPDMIDLIESAVILEPDAIYSRTDILLGAGEVLYVQSDLDNVVVRFEGYEENPL